MIAHYSLIWFSVIIFYPICFFFPSALDFCSLTTVKNFVREVEKVAQKKVDKWQDRDGWGGIKSTRLLLSVETGHKPYVENV